MSEITLHMEDSLIERLNMAAKERDCSVAQYLTSLINEHLPKEKMNEVRKKQLLLELWGSIDDPAFAVPPDVPWEAELPRRFDLL